MDLDAIRHSLDTRGYAVVPALLDRREMSRIAAGFDRLIERARHLPASQTVEGTHFVLDAHPFRLHRAVWAGGCESSLRLGDHPRFLQLACGVLGATRVVQLIQQAHFKLPGDGVTFRFHQDGSNRRYGSDAWTDVDGRGAFLQIALAVDAMDGRNGALRVVPGSHRHGFIADPTTGDLPDGAWDPADEVDLTLSSGDAVVFGPFLIHGSPANRGRTARRLFLQGYALPGANRRSYPGCGTGVTRVLGAEAPLPR